MESEENSIFSEQRSLINKVLAASSDCIYMSDRQLCYRYANSAGLAALGLEQAQLLGKTCQELGFAAQFMEVYDVQSRYVFQTGIPVKGETSFSTVNGVRRYEYVIAPIWENEGEIEAVITSSRDITERKQVEDSLRLLTQELEAKVINVNQELVALNKSLSQEIAKRQKAQQVFRESEMRFHTLVNAMFEGMVIQENGKIIEANPGFAKMFGYTLEEVIGKSAVDFLTSESLETFLHHIQNQYEMAYEITGIKKDGTLIPLEVVSKPSFYQGRSVRISAARDITERKQAEAERTRLMPAVSTFEDIWERKQAEQILARESLRIQSLFNTSFDGIVILDKQGSVLDANLRFTQMLGYTPEEIVKLNIFDWDAQFNHEELQQLMQDYIHCKSGVLETRHRRKDGSIYDVEISFNVVEWEGEILRFYVCRDITERKRAEAALRESQMQLQHQLAEIETIYQSAPIGLNVLDTQLRFVRINERLAQMNGFSVNKHIGRTVSELLPNLADAAEQLLRPILETGKPVLNVEITGETPAHPGVQRTWLESFLPLKDGNRIIGINTVCQEITDRKQAEIALQEREATLRLFAQYAPAGIAMFDRQMCYLMASQRWVNDYHLDSVESLIGRSHYEIFPEIPERWRQIHQRCLAGGSEKCHEDLFVRSDGTQQWIRWEIHPWYTAIGEISGIIVFSEDITQHKLVEIALRENEQKLKLALQAAKAGAWTWDLKTNKLYWSEEYYRVFGLEPNSIKPSYENSFSRLHPEDRERVETEVAQAIEEGKNTNVEYRILLPDGIVRWVIGIGQMFYDESNRPERMAGIVVDITERKLAEEALYQSEERFRRAILDAPLPIMLHTEDEQILQINHTWAEITGYSIEDTPTIADWIAKAYDASHQEQVRAQINSLYHINNRIAEGEYTIKTSTGETRIWDFYSAPLGQLPDGRNLIISTAFDVTSRKQAELQLRQNAFYDSLTSLPNRALFVEYLKYSLQQAKRQKNYLFAVLFLDLDRFKVINDSLGHIKGDRFLITIAQILQTCIRSTDIAARFGGDEFIILLPGIQDAWDAIKVAERIQKELKLPLKLDEQELFTSASIGIALSSTQDYNQPEQLLRDADTAMYQAKALGKSRYVLFNPNMYALALTRLQLEADLRQAIQNQEFQLHYQPIVSLISGSIIGFEALLRWQHPERGLVFPSDFIPLAEETGLIVDLGYWTLYEACRQMQAWLVSYPHQPLQKMSVNLSAKQFSQPNLIEQIRQILLLTRLNPKNLALEITETVIVENGDEAIAILKELQQLGIEISIDDFGTGYSSLGRLYSFPISVLKIDRSFVNPMATDNRNLDILEIIVALAHKLGMTTIAEGVETKEQLAMLKNLNCESGQGYLFSQPLSKSKVLALINDNSQ